MERLTFEGNFCDIAQCRELPCKYPDTGCTQREVWERLKAYEDTGLEPEEVAEQKAENDELKRRIVFCPENFVAADLCVPTTRLRELARKSGIPFEVLHSLKEEYSGRWK